MKKIMILLVAAVTLSSAVTAQTAKLDVEGLKKKLASSDADIEHPKKGAKAATWVNRGNIYFQAATAPTANVFKGMGTSDATLILGEPTETRAETVGSRTYDVWVYPHFDLYIAQQEGAVHFWKQKTVIVDNGLETAYQAYLKAIEIDPSQAEKVKPSIEKIMKEGYVQNADLSFSAGNYAEAAQSFAKAYELSVDPLIDQPDTLSAYYAGYISIVNEDFPTAKKYLELVKEMGYEGEPADGELYFLLYHTYDGLKDSVQMENILKEGVQKYPANPKLSEVLVFYYTSTGQDATVMIPLVQSALANDPDNFVFHFGLGLIYSNLEDFDNAIASFGKAAQLNDEDFSSHYNLAVTYIRRADAMLPEIQAIPMNEQAYYEEKLGEFNAEYKKALPELEKAHTLKPDNPTVIELLKNIYFRFRDDSPEMMSNFEKFDALWKSM
ncbi:MAG: hypothetical protein LUD68_11410 [Rikenellaceae bacterium]|nr:hypothetical protein [Rikenellaceae bacterium]